MSFARDPAIPVVAVIVTRDRPELLRRCILALLAQRPRPPAAILVVDNDSGPETAEVLAAFPQVEVLRQHRNLGGAGGFRAGMAAALARGARRVWLMDDDGHPADPACLDALVAAADAGADLAAPLVLDDDDPARLAFPIRLRGHTRFDAAAIAAHGPVPGFAHLFNGALASAALLRRVGPPDPRFMIRGDEVDWLHRVRDCGGRVVLDPAARFRHPGSAREIHPILGGRFYAVVPSDPAKAALLFRNRAHIFRARRMWPWLAADLVRYGLHFAGRRDAPGLAAWLRATGEGLRGDFMRGPRPGWHDGEPDAPGLPEPRWRHRPMPLPAPLPPPLPAE